MKLHNINTNLVNDYKGLVNFNYYLMSKLLTDCKRVDINKLFQDIYNDVNYLCIDKSFIDKYFLSKIGESGDGRNDTLDETGKLLLGVHTVNMKVWFIKEAYHIYCNLKSQKEESFLEFFTGKLIPRFSDVEINTFIKMLLTGEGCLFKYNPWKEHVEVVENSGYLYNPHNVNVSDYIDIYEGYSNSFKVNKVKQLNDLAFLCTQYKIYENFVAEETSKTNNLVILNVS